LLFIGALLFVGSFTMLLLFVRTFFAVHGAAGIVVSGLTLLFFLGLAFLGIVVTAIATTEQIEEEGISSGCGLSLGGGLGAGAARCSRDFTLALAVLASM